MQEPDLKRRGLMLVLSSPSGAGKTTITRALLERCEGMRMSVSVTTRTPRPGEIDGEHYHFVTVEKFKEMVERKELLEYALVFGNYYGTPIAPVEQALADSHDIIFDIDWQGTQQIRQKLANDLVTVFILPPSREELERRLRKRQQDNDETIAHRMQKAADEISHYSEYDYIIVNRDLEQSIRQVQSILDSQRLRRRRFTDLPDFIHNLTDTI